MTVSRTSQKTRPPRWVQGWIRAAAVFVLCLNPDPCESAPPKSTASKRRVFVLPEGRSTALAALLPERPAPVLLVPAKDRKAWVSLRGTPDAVHLLAEADRILREGMTPWEDAMYLEYRKTGGRARADQMVSRRTGELNCLVLAEAVDFKGRYIPAISAALESLAKDRSWTFPAHDPKLENFEGRRTIVELASARRAIAFAGALQLLGTALPAPTRGLARQALETRIFQPVRASLRGEGDFLWWTEGGNNWNPVCYAGVILAALWTLEDRQDRATFLAAAEAGRSFYFGGIPGDGYCTEGIGYWNYGFGNYCWMALAASEATAGQLNWFDSPHILRTGSFGRRIRMLEGKYPAYADCSPFARPAPWIQYFMDRIADQLHRWKTPPRIGEDSIHAFCQSHFPTSAYHTAQPILGIAPDKDSGDSNALRDFFREAGVLNVRPADSQAADAFAVSIKGGNNAEQHNHNDLGSFVVATPNATLPLLVDPGAERYTSRTFSPRRYESRILSSWGHPVPLVDGMEQVPGRDSAARILETDFTPARDTLSMDLATAYRHVEGLSLLTRTFRFHRTGGTRLEVCDILRSDRPVSFGTALLTYGSWQKMGPQTLRITGDGDTLEIHVDASPLTPVILATLIDEETTHGGKPTRIGIDLPGKHVEATIRLVIRRKQTGLSTK